MKLKYIMWAIGCFIVVAAGSGWSDLTRSAGGNWQDTVDTWKEGGSFTNRLPTTSDAVKLYSTESAIIDLYESAVSITSLSIGEWGGASKTVTLLVRNNLTTANAISIAITGNLGSGAMIVSNATVSSASLTQIGKTSNGSLTIEGGGVFQNTAWRVDLGAYASVSIDDGRLSMLNNIIMADGATIDINGNSELWISGNHTGGSANLTQYINSGWITGNGEAGNVDVIYDGAKTIVTAVPEPTTLGLFAMSSIGLFLARKHFLK